MTANSIVAIDKTSVHRICSGQVVLDLATAAKELIENSLDANATTIEVRFKEYGLESVEVIDNGTGVEPHNYEVLALKHYTSKLNSFEDLAGVASFGFRGEALSSLCALSKLTVTTRTKNQASVGVRLEYDFSGRLTSKSPTPRERGTTVNLQDLFHSLPVRYREFKKKIKREYAKTLALIQAYAIISEDVRIICTNQIGKGEKTKVIGTNGNKTVRENIANVFGTKLIAQLMPIDIRLSSSKNGSKGSRTIVGRIDENDVGREKINKKSDESGVCIIGFITKPIWGSGRSNADRQYFYINGRPCTLPKIAKLVNEVYREFNSNQYPLIVADIRLPKGAYDVNISPDKRTIFLHDEKQLLEALADELVALFEPSRSTYVIGTLTPKSKALDIESTVNDDEAEHEANDTNDFMVLRDPSPPTSPPLSSTALTVTSSYSVASSPDLTKQYVSSNSTITEDHDPQTSSPLDTVVDDTNLKRATSLNRLRSLVSSTSTNMPFKMKFATDPLTTIQSRRGENWQTDNSSSSYSFASSSVVNFVTHFTKVSAVGQIIEGSTEINKGIGSDREPMLAQDSEQGNKIAEGTCEAEEPQDPSINDNDDVEDVEIVKAPSNLKCEATVTTLEMMELGLDSLQSGLVERDSMTVDFDYSQARRRFQRLFSPLTVHPAASPEVIAKTHLVSAHATDNDEAERELCRVVDKRDFAAMSILGQFNLGFIVTKLEKGGVAGDLFIVDQHASDEKYNFEALQRETRIQSQKLIRPRIPELTVAEELIAMENIEILCKNGFEIEVDPDAEPTKRIKIVSQPISKNTLFDIKDFEELIFLLTDRPGEMVRCTRARAMFASRACRKSVMIGDSLSKGQMQKIVRHMGEIDQPWNCPHGRPTMRHLFDLSVVRQSQRQCSLWKLQ
ncbi:mismatch repair endonuclease PMS2 [Endogone sp. FLAS-F59071]|nr:mismatch repair endonuclease PMS2 [Endogone sp. FLAS-F59071]|eukprot:RUS22609.1 mismatch repair endonuclease PMS2 [Endogone sp. FLAS-F59071]